MAQQVFRLDVAVVFKSTSYAFFRQWRSSKQPQTGETIKVRVGKRNHEFKVVANMMGKKPILRLEDVTADEKLFCRFLDNNGWKLSG